MDESESKWSYENVRARIIKSSPLEDRVRAIEETAEAINDLEDKQKVTAIQLVVQPLSTGTVNSLRNAIYANLEKILSKCPAESIKFVIGGLLLEMDGVSKKLLNAIGSRMAQEESILWLNIVQIILEKSTQYIKDDVAKKVTIVAGRLATASLRGKSKPSIESRVDKRIENILNNEELKKIVEAQTDDCLLVLKIALAKSNAELRTKVNGILTEMLSDKKVSRRHELYILEFGSRYFDSQSVKDLVPQIKKQMLRSPEIGITRVHAIINGLVSQKMDLSPFVLDLHEVLVKVLVGSNEENIVIAKEALRTLYTACNDKDAKLDTIAEYLRKVWNGKEGKISESGKKINILSIFDSFGQSPIELKRAAVDALCANAEKEGTEMVLTELFRTLNIITQNTPDEKIIKTLFEGIAKHSKLLGPALYGLISALYGQITTETVTLFDKNKVQTLVDIFGKMEKNPSASCASAKILQKIMASGGEVGDYKTKVVEKLASMLSPKILKLICSNFNSLDQLAVFGINTLKSGKEISEDLKNLLLTIVTRHFLTSDYNKLVETEFNAAGGPGFSKISAVFSSEMSGMSDQRCTRMVNKIVSMAVRTQKIEITKDLILCATRSPLNSAFWRKSVFGIVPSVEALLVEEFKNKLDLGSPIDSEFCQQIGILASVSPQFHSYIIELLLEKVFTDEFENVRQINLSDIGIAINPEGELWDISVIASKEKQLDKNSKDYEDQLFAREQKKKQEAKGIIKLSKDQIEAKNKQLAKESEIRAETLPIVIQFRNGVSLLSQIILEHGAHYKSEFWGAHTAELTSRLFKMLDCSIFDSDALQMTRNFSKLLADGAAPPSVCEGLVSVSARIKNSRTIEQNWTEEPLLEAINRLISLCPQGNYKAEFASIVVEFAALSMPFSALNSAVLLTKSVETLPVVQSANAMRVAIRQMATDVEEESTEENLALLLAISESLNKRSLNTMESSLPLVEGLETESVNTNSAVLSALKILHPEHGETDNQIKIEDYLSHRIYSARHSDDSELVTLAQNVMSQLSLFPPNDSIHRLCADASSGVYHLQMQAELALGELFRVTPISEEAEDYVIPEDNCMILADEALIILIEKYKTEFEFATPKFDDVGRLLKNREDRSVRRCGIAQSIAAILPAASTENAEKVFYLLVPNALNDLSPMVTEEMLNVGVTAIDVHGTKLIDSILPLFENYLQQGKSEGGADTARQSVVVLFGRLASHLPKTDPRVKPIIGQLIAALSVPSEKVQTAVAKCLPALVPAIRDDAPQVIHGLMELMLESENYGERRGGSQGLAGIIKGLGILSIKKYNIIVTLSENMQDKKNHRKREGALFGFGALCNSLGRLFEPYIIQILPLLLEAFGDNNFGVREAAEETAKSVMKSLSAHGVKLVLPSLLQALESDAWRTKVGSVELLGTMAHCAPKQLSACLPQIVPYLIEVLADSHPKVAKSGQEALSQVGSVIRNPEIKNLTPFLLEALSDPARKIAPALTKLNSTRFVHHIDAASLALIMPIVQRAFNERSPEVRKLSAQIVGGMCSRNQALCSGSDLMPYLAAIMPGLRITLTDPVPDVRATAAKAIGNVVSITPDDSPITKDLLPWLKSILISDSSAVDRSGAAQGLAEVLYAQGSDELDEIMPQMIKEASDVSLPPTVRDGYCMAFIYFPVTFKDKFAEYVSRVIPALLANLADENEYLRDTALKAGKKIIQLFADTAIALLLPELEQGLLDENWRIRYSSVQLLGDLLFHITGITGKMSSESGGGDDNFGTLDGQKIIVEILGEDCYHRVMAGIYMCRSDIALLVRQAALHVWKLVVQNTARTIREVLPILIELILQNLASEYDEKRQIASRTLGDLVKKLGERILPKLMPILNRGLQSPDDDQRQGVCIGLTEVISAASKELVSVMSTQLGPTIRAALSDSNKNVRNSAAATFEVLHTKLGIQAIEEIIPHLLDMLDASPEEKSRALDGLKQILATKGRSVLPAVLPKLTEKPVNTTTLSFLASAAGEHLSRYVDTVMDALIGALADNDCDAAILEDCTILIEGVDDEYGASLILSEIIEATKAPEMKTRKAAASLIKVFVEKTEADYMEYYGVLFRELIRLMTDPEGSPTLELAWSSLQTLVKSLDAVELQSHLTSLRQAISIVRKDVDENGHLPGFSLAKKGMNCVVPIFKECILSGSPDMKEQAAICLQEVITMTDPSALKPSVVGLAGPLIRMLGDRYGAQVKCPLLSTLELLLTRAGPALKAFLPQLQTTFLKATNDESSEIRLRGGEALGKLALHHTRIEPLVTDLVKSLNQADNPEYYVTYAHALRLVIESAGDKITQPTKQSIIDLMEENIRLSDNQSRLCSAGVLAAAISKSESQEEMIDDLLEGDVVGKIETIAIIIKLKPELLMSNQKLATLLAEHVKSEDKNILLAVLMVVTFLITTFGEKPLPSYIHKCLKEIVQCPVNEIVQRLGNNLGWSQEELESPNHQLIPYIVSGCKHANMTVKVAHENCLVLLTRIRSSESKTEELLSRVSGSGKDAIWLTEFCRVGGKLRRMALTSPIITNPDLTLLSEENTLFYNTGNVPSFN